MIRTILVLIFISIALGNPCGDWSAFKDEKCFKLVTKVSNEQDAINNCYQLNGSTLAIVENREQQDFINSLLKGQGIADNVWIGIKRSADQKFKNLDQTDLVFTNWQNDRPLVNRTGFDCVELSTDELNFGKWVDEKCQKQNAILCQKNQPWTLDKLQTALFDTRKALVNQLNYLKHNLVPIGFIYVQLANQSEPSSLWPNTQWQNISSKYSGLFFRIEDEQNKNFGQIEEQQTQSLEFQSAEYDCVGKLSGTWGPIKPGTNYNVDLLSTGQASPGNKCLGLAIKHNQEEIRPRNIATRVWIRVK